MNVKLIFLILFGVITQIVMHADNASDFKCDKVNPNHSNYSYYTSSKKDAVNNINTIPKTNTCNIVCELNLEYMVSGEAGLIKNIQLILNDSLSLFRGQTLSERINNDSYTQVSLNKLTSNYIRLLLSELYTKHSSIIKDKYINVDSLFMINGAKTWQIELNLNGKEITEVYNLLDYSFSFEKPFNPEADKILELILAIKRKMESDIYKMRDRDYTPEPWIEEMFHGEYYEPYNNINSNKYQ